MGLRSAPEAGLPGGFRDWPFLQELAALAQGRVCGPEQRRRCRAANGAFAEWACSVCGEFLQPEALSPWTWHLLFLYQLRRAGYPFERNDLTLETWLLLGMVQRVLEGTQGGRHARG